jgi:hypothetical protein
MSQDIRLIYNSTDLTTSLVDFRSGVSAFPYTSGQYLYVGSFMPFNNLWFEVGTANTNATTVSVSNWFGNSWVPAVDIRDESAGLTATGRLSWSTDRLKGWDREQTSEDVDGVTSFKIYWKYWARISWSNAMSGSTSLRYVGQKFSTDTILATYYPDLGNADLKSGFAVGKTNWDDQHYMAAEAIIADLKRGDIIVSGSQILDWMMFQEASCHKVAEIVYKAFGQPYFEQLKQARADYLSAKKVNFNTVDLNQNGNIDPAERYFSTSFLTR